MKKNKFRLHEENDRKKTTPKFKADIEEDESDLYKKRRKDVGRRMHFQKNLKEINLESDN